MNIVFIVFIIAMVTLMIIFSFKAKKRMRYFILYALSGLGLYILLCVIGNFYEPLKLNVNGFNLAISASCGVPGVLFLLALKFLL